MIRIPQNWPVGGDPAPSLAQSLATVHRRIAAAAAAAGRDVRSVTLLAVTKGQPVARLHEALALGLDQFGENYVAEALPKITALEGTGATWHFIGRLQANKTRAVAQHFAWVHSLDRLNVAERLAEQRPWHAPPLNVCVQVRVAEDPGKGGIEPEAAAAFVRSVAALPRLQLRGLMCMLPYASSVPAQHAAFAGLRTLRDALGEGLTLDTLSMGMSDDMDAAIAAGATIVRIGTALFGARPHVE